MALLAGLLVSPIAFSAPDSGYRVLHHQSIEVASRKGVGATERMTFEAYGRRFELRLAPNERIRRGISAATSGTMPLQGTVEGVPGSWVRITRGSTGLTGMLFDGRELYAIEPAAEVAPVAVQPLDASEGGTVFFRLSDALMPVQAMRCEVAALESDAGAAPTAADAVEQITSELQSFDIASATATKQIRVGVVGDTEFTRQFRSGTPEDAIVARMNIVDGIFSAQLGVKVSLSPPTLFRAEPDPFTKNVASELLVELRNYRNSSLAQRALGITHLMTGRDLDTSTVGIAYIGGLCDSQFGVSLSESTLDTVQAALVAAHEIGHNFGAPHDGESGACATTPTTFLMAAQLNNNDRFSACSIQQITPKIESARCLTNYVPPDASIEVPVSTLNGTVGTPLVASFRVRSAGDDASANVNATVALPTTVTLQSVSANGGTCTSGAGTASCTFGTLPAGDSRQVDLGLTPTSTGDIRLDLSLTSSNDATGSNNSGAITINASESGAAPPSSPPPSGGGTSVSSDGGGGGGRLDVLLLGLLGIASAGVALLRSRCR